MSDYNLYSFTIAEEDILRVLRDAVSAGCKPLLLINGMFYNIKIDAKSEEA